MNNKVLLTGVLALMVAIFLAGCAKAPVTTAPTVASENVESSSSAAESTSDGFVNDATPTSEQVVPDLTP